MALVAIGRPVGSNAAGASSVLDSESIEIRKLGEAGSESYPATFKVGYIVVDDEGHPIEYRDSLKMRILAHRDRSFWSSVTAHSGAS